MRSFLLFLVKYSAFLVFVLLQSVSFFLLLKNANYNRASFVNSTHTVVGALLETSANISDYFSLKEVNRQLNSENAKLRAQYYALLNGKDQSYTADTTQNFAFIPARVVNNNVFLLNNTLTIKAGIDKGLAPGMGVIGNGGIVGKVKRAGKHYATVVSLLDVDVQVSAEIRGKINLCTVQWDGKSPAYAQVLYVPRHYQLALGDTVVTSGFNAVYPPGIPIGTISKLHLPQDATFYEIQLKLINDFTSLSLVEVVLNKDLPQIDSLTISLPHE